MKFLKVLIVPAVLLSSVIMATPAFAHNTKIAIFSQNECQDGKFCIHLSATTDTDNNGRDIVLTLQGHNPNTDKWEDTNRTIQLNLPNGTKTFDQCFPDVAPSGFDKFRVKITVAEKAGNDLTLDTTATNLHKVFENDKVVALVSDSLTACPTPTSTATATATPPTPTPTATPAAAALASTGGFDFRFPLVGLTVLVGGLALLLVSLSRGRSPSK